MARKEKIEEWAGRLARFKRSGETISQFCSKEGVSPPSFFSWRRRLGQQLPTVSHSAPVFLPVEIVASSGRPESVVHLGRGVRIDLGSDLAVVGAIVSQLVRSLDDRKSEAESC